MQTTIQIIIVLVAVVVIFTVIRPAFAEMKAIQDEQAEYQRAVDQASLFNQRLSALLSRADDFSRDDLQSLERFLPETVDVIGVSHDIENIVSLNGLLLQDISTGEYNEELGARSSTQPRNEFVNQETSVVDTVSLSAEAERTLEPVQFSVSVVGTYDSMKRMLQDFERNVYPLRLVSFDFVVDNEQSDLYTFSFVLETYALSATN